MSVHYKQKITMNLQKQETTMEETTTPASSQNWIEKKLAEIGEIKDPQAQVEELLAFADKLLPSSSEVLKDALDAAQKIDDEKSKSQALAAIASNLPETERQKVLKNALDAAQKIDDDYERSLALAAIASNLPETERPKVLKDALDAAQKIEDDYERFPALEAIAANFSETELHTKSGLEKRFTVKVRQEVSPLPPFERGEDRRIRQEFEKSLFDNQIWNQLLQQAVDAAQKIEDEYERFSALAAIAPKLPETNPQLLQQALDIAKNLKDERSRSQALAAIAPKLPDRERQKVLQQVLNTVEKIQNEYDRSLVLVAIAPNLPDTERQKASFNALDASQNIQKERCRSQALAAIAPKLPDRERQKVLQQALDAAQNIRKRYERSQALTGIAPKLPDRERQKVLQQVLNTVEKIQNEYDRSLVLVAIVSKLPETEPQLLQQALDAAQNIQNGYDCSQALAAIVPKLPETEPQLLQQVLDAAQNIQDELYRSQVLAAIARNLPEETEREKVLQQALNAAKKIEDNRYRFQALESIAPKLPETKPQLLQQTLNTAKNIQNESYRSLALAAIAPNLPEIKRPEVLKNALDAAENIKKVLEQSQVLAIIAPKLPETERQQVFQDALNVAQKIQNEYDCSLALVTIASNLPETEPQLLQQTLNTAKNIQNESYRSEVLAAIAPNFPEIERPKIFQDALDAAQNIKKESERSYCFATIASNLPEIERQKVLKNALDAAQNIKKESERSQVLATIASNLPETERPKVLKDALDAAQNIKDENDSFQVLETIASNLPETEPQLLQQALEITFELEASKCVYPLKELIQKFCSEEIVAAIPRHHLSKALATVAELKDKPEAQIKFFSVLAPHLPTSLFSTALEGIENHTYVAAALSNLAPYISIDQIPDALSSIKKAGHSVYRTEALINLVPYLQNFEHILQTLEIIHQDILVKSHQAICLKSLATGLSNDNFNFSSHFQANTDEKKDCDIAPEKLADSLQNIKEIIDDKNQDDSAKFTAIIQGILVMVKQLKFEEKHQSQILVALAPVLPHQCLEYVLEIIESFQNIAYQVNVLCSLAPLDIDDKQKVLEIADRIVNKEPPVFHQSLYQVKVWSCFRERQDKALKKVKEIDKNLNCLRTEALVEVAVQLKALASKNITPTELKHISTVQRDALSAIGNIKNSYLQSQYIQSLAPDLVVSQLPEAQNVAKQIRNVDYRKEALVALAYHFPTIREEIRKDIETRMNSGKLTPIQGIKHLSKLAVEVPNILSDIIKRIDQIESELPQPGLESRGLEERLSLESREKLGLEREELEEELEEELPLEMEELQEDNSGKNTDHYSILVALEPHLPLHINQEVNRVYRAKSHIPDELWKRSCKVLARTYRDTLQQGSLRNESAQKEDLLNLKDEISALCDLLLMRDLEPPMTVGILGGWGHGKSYIMHLMQSYITEIRSKSVTEEEAWNGDPNYEKLSPYVGHIYQIKFDAWTFAKSNLWASLMQAIFFELDRQISLEQQLAKVLADRPEDSESRAEALRQEGKYWSVLYKTSKEDREYFLEKVLQKEQLEKFRKGAAQPDTDVNWTELLWEQYDEVKNETQEKLSYQKKQRQDNYNKKKEKEKELEEVKNKIREQEDARKRIEAELRKEAYSDVDKGIDSALGISKILLIERLGKPVFEAINNQVQTEVNQQGITYEDIGEVKNSVTKIINNILETGIVTVSENGSANKKINLNREALRQWILKKIWLIVGFIVLSLTAIALPIILENILNQRIGAAIAGLIVPLVPAIGFLQKLFRSGEKWYGKAVEILSEYGDKVEEVQKNSQKALEAKMQKDEKLLDLSKATTELEKQKEELSESIKTLEKETSELNVAIEKTKESLPPDVYASLSNFVKSRLEENSYEKHLGLMHQVKDDLWKLSNSLLPPTNATELGAKLDKLKEVFPRGIPRVVVYIDDLDRCPPDRVVEVLEAIQLLVKTPLFIAVIAIDERYITRALEKNYQGVLFHLGSPSGTDYLEKIIQLPYRVRPIIGSNLEEYLRSQVMIQDNSKGEARLSEFSRQEFNILLECCKEVDLSPRSLKRLTNVYKLFKVVCRTRAYKPNYQVQKAIIALFALSCRYSNHMRDIFNEMESCLEENRTEEKARKSSQTLHLQSPLHDFFTHYKLADKNEYLEGEFRKFKHDALETTILPEQLTLGEITQQTFNLIRSFSFVGEIGYSGDF